jgi:hypothetical protein
MKAAVCTRYGPPEVLQLRDVLDPVPGAKDVLIRIRATTVTPSDCYIRSAIPTARLAMRLMARVVIGFTRPRRPILGAVLAGEIEAIGAKVTRFHVGDPVWAFTMLRTHGLLRPAHLRAGHPQAPHAGAVESESRRSRRHSLRRAHGLALPRQGEHRERPAGARLRRIRRERNVCDSAREASWRGSDRGLQHGERGAGNVVITIAD